jgi:hypothetical protein
MAEVLSYPYSADSELVAELEHGESRTTLDTIRQFDGWMSSPPVNRQGEAVAEDAWQREVRVTLVDPDSPLLNLASDAGDSGCVRVEVIVKYQGVALASLQALRYQHWDSAVDLSQTEARHVDALNRPPQIVITDAGPLTGSSSLTVLFDASESFDPDGDQLTFEWDFGDGSTGSGQTIQHDFKNATKVDKRFTTKLTVTDLVGASSTEVFDIYLDYE